MKKKRQGFKVYFLVTNSSTVRDSFGIFIFYFSLWWPGQIPIVKVVSSTNLSKRIIIDPLDSRSNVHKYVHMHFSASHDVCQPNKLDRRDFSLKIYYYSSVFVILENDILSKSNRPNRHAFRARNKTDIFNETHENEHYVFYSSIYDPQNQGVSSFIFFCLRNARRWEASLSLSSLVQRDFYQNKFRKKKV